MLEHFPFPPPSSPSIPSTHIYCELRYSLVGLCLLFLLLYTTVARVSARARVCVCVCVRACVRVCVCVCMLVGLFKYCVIPLYRILIYAAGKLSLALTEMKASDSYFPNKQTEEIWIWMPKEVTSGIVDTSAQNVWTLWEKPNRLEFATAEKIKSSPKADNSVPSASGRSCQFGAVAVIVRHFTGVRQACWIYTICVGHTVLHFKHDDI